MINNIDNVDDNDLADDKKKLKTFSIHESNLSFVKHIKSYLFQYKHLENILNLLLKEQFELNSNNKSLTSEQIEENKVIFSLLLNPIIMKAVLSSNPGGIKTKDNVSKVNLYFQNKDLFSQAKLASINLNDKNISMVVRRIKKDWSNYFKALKEYIANPSAFSGKPSYPKAKKLSQVFNYSLPLEPDKWSLKKSGCLGINFGKKMFYVNIGKSNYFKDKIVNNVTVSYSHGHIYYNFTYHRKEQSLPKVVEKNIPSIKFKKEAGGDVGLNNLMSLFINDETTKSLIFSGKEVISYNCNFNKRLSELNELISYEVKSYKEIKDKNGKLVKVAESYTNKGKSLIKRKSQLFERRKLFFADYMNKLSKKIVEYLSYSKVTDLVLSKNLSFTKTDGSIHMQRKTKQKFYQIPFGNLLNLIESKAEEKFINITWINEAYTSKTSSISAEVVEVQKLATIDKNLIKPNDLNGNRGVKRKNDVNNKLGRGLFKDNIINKVINADINAACNHVKIAFNYIDKIYLQKYQDKIWKWCNPVKIKSNHEFDKLLKQFSNNQIVDRQNGSTFYLTNVA